MALQTRQKGKNPRFSSIFVKFSMASVFNDQRQEAASKKEKKNDIYFILNTKFPTFDRI